jgi:hypothetical protein
MIETRTLSRALRAICLSVAVAALARSSGAASSTTSAKRNAVRAKEMQAVFVRMKTQVIGNGAAYVQFCADNRDAKRRELRQRVVEQLKGDSRTSWNTVRDRVQALQQTGEITHLRRYWVANGFACIASTAACTQLEKLEAISYIYRQSQIAQHDTGSPAKAISEAHRRAIQQAAADWHDDSFDPLHAETLTTPWNLEFIKADDAWRQGATGKGVVVALVDSGVRNARPFVQALWRNNDETFDGRDSDGNGFVDDVFGFNFRDRNGNVFLRDDQVRDNHGNICAGIVAARPSTEKRIVTGVAPRAKLMILSGSWSIEPYEYALENGADVVSMSFALGNAGQLRGLYRTVFEHLSAAGVVAVGGAGNWPTAPVGLPKDIPCVIAVAGVLDEKGTYYDGCKGSRSWRGIKFYANTASGTKPDVTACAGRYPFWGHPDQVERLRHGKIVQTESPVAMLMTTPDMKGNSFSGPHAAGVAALMLSANPDLPAWRVKELMENTCRDLGARGRDKKFGAGLINAADAVRAARMAQ